MKTDINSRMKAEPGDKLVEMSCDTCEFNFGNICADYGISLGAFIEQEKMNNR